MFDARFLRLAPPFSGPHWLMETPWTHIWIHYPAGDAALIGPAPANGPMGSRKWIQRRPVTGRRDACRRSETALGPTRPSRDTPPCAVAFGSRLHSPQSLIVSVQGRRVLFDFVQHIIGRRHTPSTMDEHACSHVNHPPRALAHSFSPGYVSVHPYIQRPSSLYALRDRNATALAPVRFTRIIIRISPGVRLPYSVRGPK
jgi:hypothetical protein